MFEGNLAMVLDRIDDGALVLDVGGWGRPLRRADWVLDRMPHATRGLYGFDGDGPERFDATRWVQLDICDREPWPFADGQFDFVVCSHTLEDVRDPIGVCGELVRVARAGYVEVPSRLEEQSFGIQGPWVGWGHHPWIVEPIEGGLEFAMKHHVLHGRDTDHFPAGFHATLAPEEKVTWLLWEGGFEYRERIFTDAPDLDRWLADFVATELERRGWPPPGEAGRRRRFRRGS